MYIKNKNKCQVINPDLLVSLSQLPENEETKILVSLNKRISST